MSLAVLRAGSQLPFSAGWLKTPPQSCSVTAEGFRWQLWQPSPSPSQPSAASATGSPPAPRRTALAVFGGFENLPRSRFCVSLAAGNGFQMFPPLRPGPASRKLPRFHGNRVTSLPRRRRQLLPSMPRAASAGAPLRVSSNGPHTWDDERRSPGAPALCPRQQEEAAVPGAGGSAPSLLRAPPAAENAGVSGQGESARYPSGGLHGGKRRPGSRRELCGARQHGLGSASRQLACLLELRVFRGTEEGNGHDFRAESPLPSRRAQWPARLGLCTPAVALGRVCGWCFSSEFLLFAALYCCDGK